MESINKNWQIEIDGKIFETDTETLKKWISEGRVSPSHKVRRDSLRWIEISEIPLLMICFQKNKNAERPSKTSAANSRSGFQNLKFRTDPYKRTDFHPNKVSVKSTSLPIVLIISALFSALVGVGWIMYSNHRDRSQVINNLTPNYSGQISSLKAYEDNEERIKQINQPGFKPVIITKKSTMELGCFYWLNQAVEDEEQSRINRVINERAAAPKGEPYDTSSKPSQYRKKYEECIAEEKLNKANVEEEAKVKKLDIEKTLLENRENLRKQVKYDTVYKFLLAFGISFLILGAISYFQHLKSKPFD